MISIYHEIQKIISGEFDKIDNPLKNAPHTVDEISSNDWLHHYTRQQAAFPNIYLKHKKYWPPVARIDNVYGDRNLFCSCPPINNYEDLDKTG